MFTEDDFLKKELKPADTAEEWIYRLKECERTDELDGLLFNAFENREDDPLVARVILTVSGARTRSERHTKLVTTARNVLMGKLLKKPKRTENDWTAQQDRNAQAPWFATVRKDPSLFKLLVITLDKIYEDRLPNSHKELVQEFVDTCLGYHGYRIYGDHSSDDTDTEMMEIINGSMNDLVRMVFGCHLSAHFALDARTPDEKGKRDRQRAVLIALEHMVFASKPVTKADRAKLVNPDYDRGYANELHSYYSRRRYVIMKEEDPKLEKAVTAAQEAVNRLERARATGDFSPEMEEEYREKVAKSERFLGQLQALRLELAGLP